MEFELFTVVHPIGPDNFPGNPDGWRWAIHTDNRFHQWAQGCLNAHWHATQADAEVRLSEELMTLRRGLTAAGVKSTVKAHVLADCPFTADMSDEMAVLM